ncbi:hypothetical protein MMC11_007475 [Xylographa trunciseda]|nr:hypothetical protein [Xylographa trunciseda]
MSGGYERNDLRRTTTENGSNSNGRTAVCRNVFDADQAQIEYPVQHESLVEQTHPDLLNETPASLGKVQGGGEQLDVRSVNQRFEDSPNDQDYDLEKDGQQSPASRTLAPKEASKQALEPDTDEVTYPEGGLRAWLVVFGAFCGMLAAFGLANAVGTYQAYLSTNQLANYDESTIGWIFSIYVFLAFFGGVQIGPVFDAKGPRWLILAGSVCLVAAVMGLAEATEYWHFILTFGIFGGLGTSLIFTPAMSSIGHFFMVSRGNASGLAATGGSVGGIMFPLLLQHLFETIGYAWATRIMGFILLFLVLVANLFIRSRLPPKVGSSVWPDPGIFKDKVFALTTAGVFFIEWALFIPISYITSYALHVGFNSTFSYQLLAILNVGSFFGRWLPGYAADRWGRFNTMIITVFLCLMFVIGLWLPAATPHSAVRDNVPLIVIFVLGFGFASGSAISLTPVSVGQLCETEQYGRYYATCYTVVSFGCLTGIPIAGALISLDGGEYWGLILFTGACYLVGLVCFTTARIMSVGWGLKAVF